jgi:uncharacterized protein YhaN
VIFARISLQAFGHFAGGVLDFSARPHGLHVVYGPNEAGKSTTLRALTALLFGVPEQSADTFLHAGKDIRVGAEVRADGRVLEFVRRKGRKSTLLAVDGTPLEDDALDPFLGGVDERLWQALFGLDHQALRAGAQALLAGDGALGESLFDAGAGTGSVRTLLSRLREESDTLYTRRGRNKVINQQIAALDAARQQVLESTTSAVGYLRQEEMVLELQSELQRVRGTRQELQSEKSRSERLLRTLPLLAQRASLMARRQAVGPVPVLEADAEKRRLDNQRLLEEAELRAEHERAEIGRVSTRLAILNVPEALAAIEATRVEEISQRLGGYRKARTDQPKREGELRAVREEALSLLRSLGRDVPLDAAETLRLSPGDTAKVRRLIREKTQADTKRDDCVLKIKRSSDQVAKRQRELAALPRLVEIAPLERSVVRAQKHVEQELQLQGVKDRLLDLEGRIARQRSSLAGVTFDSSGVDLQPLNEVQVREYEAAFQSHIHAEATRRAAHEQLLSQLLSVQQRLATVHAGGDIPTESKLQELRANRDQLLFSALSSERLPASWASEFGAALRQTDGYADRLFREAARVAQSEAIQRELAAASAALQAAEQDLRTAREQLQQLKVRWQDAWRDVGFEVGQAGVRELQEWAVGYRELRTLYEQQNRERQNERRLEASLGEVIAELSQELVRVGESARLLWESLPQFVERAELAVERIRRGNVARKDLEQRLELERQQLAELQVELTELKETEKLWRGDWQTALKQLGLGRDAGADAVSETLDTLAELFRKLEEMRGLERRIAGMQRDAELYSQELDDLIRATLPQLLSKPVETRTEEWVVAYRQATADSRERARLLVELEQRQSQLARAEVDARRFQAHLDELLAVASVSTLPELIAVERKAAELHQLEAAIAEEERKLIAHGEGASLEQLLEQAKGSVADELRARIAAIEVELGQLETRADVRTRELVAAEQQLVAMQEGAAIAAEELAGRTAELTVSVGTYRKLRLAIALLSQEIERYRTEHQGPVLGRASELFPRLTLGRYKGLQVGFDEKDQQILLCVTDGGREVSVSGLSDGTRDQLYLSLRVATLERYLERGPALPIVLDDVLIHFDDARAAAALEVLGELATHTQVLFFTHHARIVELARQHVPENVLEVHSLPRTG